MLRIEPKPFQFNFLFSKARYPAFVGGWGTGKTLFAILRAVFYSENIPNNLGIIFRKTYRSLADSTVKDFEKYTNSKVNAEREFTFPNGSTILFRHLDELASINQQNINLGFCYIEQAEELESDREFWMLLGRLRRVVQPNDDFKKYGLPERSGWIIGNAGDNWIKRLWKDGGLENSELIEATTYDNKDNLPEDFIQSLSVIEKRKPEIYRQYVLNDWSVSTDQFILITNSSLEALKGKQFYHEEGRKVVACDPSMGGDECVIYAMQDSKIIDEKILHYDDTMKITGEIMIMMHKHEIEYAAVDSIGIGKGIVDRLAELGQKVIPINSAEKAIAETRFYNKRAEMWWTAMERILDGECEYPADAELRKQLTSVRYRVVDSNGKIKLEPKEDTKERLECSPDRADAYIYGLWAMRHVPPKQPKANDFRRVREPAMQPGYGWEEQRQGRVYGY